MKRQLLIGILLLIVASATRGEEPSTLIRFPTLGNQVERQAVLLAIDDDCLPLKKNLCYYISIPKVRPEPVLTPCLDDPNAPDHVAAHFYGTVLRENGKFRMWYYGLGWREKCKVWREGPVCYAESDDGLNWTRPELGQVSLNGSTKNNAIALPDQVTEGVFMIRDDDDPEPQRRYKMVYENASRKNCMSVRSATSADGITWKAGPEDPIDEGLEPCAFYRYNGLYIINAQSIPPVGGEGGHPTGRQGFTWLSTDFKNWLSERGQAFNLPEPANPHDRGIDKSGDQVHIGVASTNFGNVFVGLYCQWHNHPKPGDWFGYGTTAGDFGLVISHDGQHFQEPVKGHVFLHRKESSPELSTDIHYENILCQGNGILNVGDETWIYHGTWANTEQLKDYYGDIRLATLPRDRWGALGLMSGKPDGSLWSAPITLPQGRCNVALNAESTSSMRVELADEKFGLLPEFSGDHSGTCVEKAGLDCGIQWPHGSLDQLAGKTVRIHVHLKKAAEEPRLYAIYLTSLPTQGIG